MSHADPPPIATWLLEHWTPGRLNDALAGDLLEEFRSGRKDRTGPWYWRQVLTAIAIGWLSEILNRRVSVIFAALWSMLAPAWMHYSFKIEAHGNFIGRIWRIEWPWSTICDFSLNLAVYISFIWAGMLLYLVVHVGITRKLNLQQFGRGLFRSVPVFISVFALIFTLGFLLPRGHPVDRRTVTLLSVITDIRLWSLMVRSPYLMAILSGLWSYTLRPASTNNKIVA